MNNNNITLQEIHESKIRCFNEALKRLKTEYLFKLAILKEIKRRGL